MLDTAAMEIPEEIADAPVEPRIQPRRPAQLVPTPVAAPATTPSWLNRTNLIIGGLAVTSFGILVAAIATSQPKPAERIDPFKPTTLNDVAPQILAENREKQAQSLAELNALAEEGLKQDDKAAIRILAAKYVIDANKAVQGGPKGDDKQCLRSPSGLDCYLNIKEEAWSARRREASLAKNAEEMVRATTNLRAIEEARKGKVELVETDPELTELALRNRYNTRIDILRSSANEKARKLNQKL